MKYKWFSNINCESPCLADLTHLHMFQVKGKYVLKSGTDFRQFSVITINFSEEKPVFDIQRVEVTHKVLPDAELTTMLAKYTGKDNLFTRTVI